MKTKLFEVRDRHTLMVFLGVNMNPVVETVDREYRLLRRSGFGPTNLIMWVDVNGGRESTYDPYAHRGSARTGAAAHHYGAEHWGELGTGDVIDIEFILGETTVKKESEL